MGFEREWNSAEFCAFKKKKEYGIGKGLVKKGDHRPGVS